MRHDWILVEVPAAIPRPDVRQCSGPPERPAVRLFKFSKQQADGLRPRIGDDAAQAIEAGFHAPGQVRAEMIPRVDHDPSGAKHRRGVDITAQISVHRLADERGEFRDVDRGRSMQAETQSVPLALAANPARPRRVDARERVVAAVELHVDDWHAIPRGPRHSLLQRQLFADVDADPPRICHVSLHSGTSGGGGYRRSVATASHGWYNSGARERV